jgi:hypothetical protein
MSKSLAVAQKRKRTEDEVHALLSRHLIELEHLLLTPKFRQVLAGIINGWIILYKYFEREARRKKPSKQYHEAFKKFAAGDLSVFGDLKPEQIIVVEQMLRGLLDTLRGATEFPRTIDAQQFVSVVKKVFVPAKKRGPKNRGDYDEAYIRHVRGEEVSSIARDMEPDAYQRDPVNTLQRYCNAIKRRQPFHNKAK